MSICQRKTGQWLVKYKESSSGRWLQKQFRSKGEAEAFDASARIAVEKDRPITVREAVLAYAGSRDLSRARVQMYDRIVNGDPDGAGVASFLADRRADSLNRRDLEALRSRCRDRGLRATSVNHYALAISAVLRWCASEDLIPVSPWAKYRVALPGAKYEHRAGTMEDLRRVCAHLPDWMRWAVRTAFALCLRPGLAELFSLEWSAFDWRAGTATVEMPKTGTSKTVFVPPWYAEEAVARCASDLEAGRSLVCPGARGRRIAQKTSYLRPWWRGCRKAGVRVHFYAIRHIAASEMIAGGADMASVSAQLGHRDMSTTAQFYARALARAQRTASLALPDPGAVAVGGAW